MVNDGNIELLKAIWACEKLERLSVYLSDASILNYDSKEFDPPRKDLKSFKIYLSRSVLDDIEVNELTDDPEAMGWNDMGHVVYMLFNSFTVSEEFNSSNVDLNYLKYTTIFERQTDLRQCSFGFSAFGQLCLDDDLIANVGHNQMEVILKNV